MIEERITSSTGGQKGSKLARFDLLDSSFLWKVAEVMGYGSTKYSPQNWRLGYDWGLSMAACQRHIHQFWNGEDNDQESGLPHLAHACFHLMAMYVFSQGRQYRQFDSRLREGAELTPDSEVVMVPDFPREVERETIEDLDTSLADTAEMPVVKVEPDHTNVFFTDEEMSARLRQNNTDAWFHPVVPTDNGSATNILDLRQKRSAEIADRMAKMLESLQGVTT